MWYHLVANISSPELGAQTVRILEVPFWNGLVRPMDAGIGHCSANIR